VPVTGVNLIGVPTAAAVVLLVPNPEKKYNKFFYIIK
jgi:hypothetical protein